MKTITLTQPGDYEFSLNQAGEKLLIIGRFKIEHQEKFNLNLTVNHRAKNTSAKISLKATVNDVAFASIKGHIIVGDKATGTNSFLEERILLLSSTATAEAIPNLEIMTNDVSCSHAATVGEIDEKQLFYLSSRGLPQEEAKRLIAEGFLK
jgi:Fe-S cluster assembly protein SufD